MAIILPTHLHPIKPQHKHVYLKTQAGAELSMQFTLQDDLGYDSAVEYLGHLHDTLRKKMGEPVLAHTLKPAMVSVETLKQQILYIAGLHDSMFGTFNPQSALPDQERADFIELFLLAVATVIPGGEIRIELLKPAITSNGT
ncbi:MAG: hypothetical protein M0Z83_01880 [Betaproteobacteria bacterium]|nr:hypothetical protein [Betaproteobacteria bacterium]